MKDIASGSTFTDFVTAMGMVVLGVALLALLVMVLLRSPLRRFNRARAQLGTDVRRQVATLRALAALRSRRSDEPDR